MLFRRSLEIKLKNYEKIKDLIGNVELKKDLGRLEIRKNKYSIQFYNVIKDGNKSKVIFIPKSQKSKAKELAYNSYISKLKKLTDKRLRQLNQLLKDYSDTEIDDLYENLNQNRKKLFEPIIPTNNQKFEEWNALPHKGKPFYPGSINIITNKGERVRSKSEKIYADKFYSLGIEYKYESPLRLDEYTIFYPDFTFLINGEIIIWEHFGMMDNPEYAAKAIKKIALYEKNGIHLGVNLIVTFETSKSGLDEELIDTLIRRHLL